MNQIRQARLTQNHAMSIGDVEFAASFWTEDITLRRGFGASVIGKEAYRQLLDENPKKRGQKRLKVSGFSPFWRFFHK